MFLINKLIAGANSFNLSFKLSNIIFNALLCPSKFSCIISFNNFFNTSILNIPFLKAFPIQSKIFVSVLLTFSPQSTTTSPAFGRPTLEPTAFPTLRTTFPFNFNISSVSFSIIFIYLSVDNDVDAGKKAISFLFSK